MKTIRIYCKQCNEKLTDDLYEIDSNKLRFEDRVGAIDSGKFSILEERSNVKELIVAIEDYNLINHKDSKRFAGCCGSAGIDGMNKTCINGHDVATEVSDCWTSHAIFFNLNKIIVKEIIDDYNVITIKF